MSNAAKPFAFSQFVPGFDFLKSLTGGGAGGAVPGLPGLSNWVAPTLSVEELDKRINELKTVQYWLEQNVHALKATIQALEVQKMTLSTLQGMNVRMEDLANAFTRGTASAAAAMREAATAAAVPAAAPEAKPAAVQAPAPEPAPAEEVENEAADAQASQATSRTRGGQKADAAPAQGVVDTLQWWNSLTQQFQQIASNALQDAAQLRMPGVPGAAGPNAAAAPRGKGRSAAGKTAGAAAKAPSTAARKAAPSRGSRSRSSSAKPAAARKPGGR